MNTNLYGYPRAAWQSEGMADVYDNYQKHQAIEQAKEQRETHEYETEQRPFLNETLPQIREKIVQEIKKLDTAPSQEMVTLILELKHRFDASKVKGLSYLFKIEFCDAMAPIFRELWDKVVGEDYLTLLLSNQVQSIFNQLETFLNQNQMIDSDKREEVYSFLTETYRASLKNSG